MLLPQCPFVCVCWRLCTLLPQLGPDKWSGQVLYAGLVLSHSCMSELFYSTGPCTATQPCSALQLLFPDQLMKDVLQGFLVGDIGMDKISTYPVPSTESMRVPNVSGSQQRNSLSGHTCITYMSVCVCRISVSEVVIQSRPVTLSSCHGSNAGRVSWRHPLGRTSQATLQWKRQQLLRFARNCCNVCTGISEGEIFS